jgi:putative ABC transport system permease protein
MEPLLKIAPQDIPRLSNTRVDAVVLCYTLGVSMLTGIVFGLAPALFASKVDLTAALKQGARGRMSGSSRELLKVGFLITEVALAVIVVIGAGLLARSIVRLYAVDPGFNAQNVLALDVSLPESKYKGAERRSFFKQATERISALPGVQSAAVALSLPLTGGAWGSVYVVEGRPIPAQSELPSTLINVVDPQYFQLMEIPLLRGRHFTDFDNANSPRVTIINKSMADRWWPNDDPIGKRIKQGFPEGQGPYLEIVGVVADVKQSTLDGLDQTEIYLADTQEPMGSMSIVVKTVSDPLLLAAAIKREIYEIDKDQPVRGIQPMSQYLSESTARKRFLTLLLGFFAAVALLLAAMGVYGVMSYSVASRKHEIGIRMALGAKSSDVLKLVLGQAALFAAIGLGIGLGTAFVVTQWMASELFEVSAQDPLTFILVPVVLAGVALLASYIPARRAIKIDPMIALRYE